jgi:hypothetical protein
MVIELMGNAVKTTDRCIAKEKASMNSFSKLLLIFVSFLSLFPITLQAGQQAYLSESPNGRYRVLVEQVLDRRVVDNIFFRYPIILENIKNPERRFETADAGTPLVHETDKKTFEIQWDNSTPPQLTAVRFDWAPDSLKYFMYLEVLDGVWKTYFVDINKGTTTDITADLEKTLMDKVDFHNWDCEQPKFQVVHWTQPNLVFLKLTSICGKNKEKENTELFYANDSVLFDTQQVKAVTHCDDCSDKASLKKFDSYYIKSIPTPTPTPEETPTTE